MKLSGFKNISVAFTWSLITPESFSHTWEVASFELVLCWFTLVCLRSLSKQAQRILSNSAFFREQITQINLKALLGAEQSILYPVFQRLFVLLDGEHQEPTLSSRFAAWLVPTLWQIYLRASWSAPKGSPKETGPAVLACLASSFPALPLTELWVCTKNTETFPGLSLRGQQQLLLQSSSAGSFYWDWTDWDRVKSNLQHQPPQP